MSVSKEEIERNFASAGWELDGSFGDHLAIGSHDGISILAHKEEWGTESPYFEILDHEKMITNWCVKCLPPSRLKSCSTSTSGNPKSSGTASLRRRLRHAQKRNVATYWKYRLGRKSSRPAGTACTPRPTHRGRLPSPE